MYSPFKKYKDIFGKPGTGIHKYRFLGTSISDYVLTIFLAVAISYFTKIPLVLTTILAFILGIILHIIFGVETNSTRYLGFKLKYSYKFEII